MSEQIRFREGYRYQLAEYYEVQIPILPPEEISTRFIRLKKDGWLRIRQDYAWDGPSGPTQDTLSTMRAALVHDVLYSLIREGYLGPESRGVADLIFRTMLIEDGVFPPRAELFYRAVVYCAGPMSEPASVKPVLSAP